MRSIILAIFFLISISSFGYVNSVNSLPRGAKDHIGNKIDAKCIALPSVTYNVTGMSSSVDPFSSKTNKYAESNIVVITAKAKGIHAVFSSSGTSATTAGYYIDGGNSESFIVDSGYKYLRLIETEASAEAFVTEIY